MRKQINICDRFRDCTAFWNTWEVERIYADPMGVPHAVISNTADARERRTIACSTLLDRRRFRLVTEDVDMRAAAVSAASGPGRRISGGVSVHPHY
ncbi:MAG TPA: hypothetical protein VIK47_04175 [Kiloniellales bacterium]